jgi:hypothetical protein
MNPALPPGTQGPARMLRSLPEPIGINVSELCFDTSIGASRCNCDASVCYARDFDGYEPMRKLKDIDGLFNGAISTVKALSYACVGTCTTSSFRDLAEMIRGEWAYIYRAVDRARKTGRFRPQRHARCGGSQGVLREDDQEFRGALQLRSIWMVTRRRIEWFAN